MGLTEPLSDGISAGPMMAKLTDPLGARLLERTRTFRDRVQESGGSIENGSLENLYDPILRKVKEWGLLSDLVFFGAASAVETNSGSIATLFDASGNENDATQSDSAKQPTDTTDSEFGGRAVALSDGSDDILTSSLSSHTQPTTHLTLVRTDDPNTNDQRTISTTGGGDTTPYQTININNGDWVAFAGSQLRDGSPGSSPVILSSRFDGTDSIIWRDGTNEVTGDAGTYDIGSQLALLNLPGRTEVFNGPSAMGLVIAAKLTDHQLSEIESTLTSYYSL